MKREEGNCININLEFRQSICALQVTWLMYSICNAAPSSAQAASHLAAQSVSIAAAADEATQAVEEEDK